jgi:hypothetical protein
MVSHAAEIAEFILKAAKELELSTIGETALN